MSFICVVNENKIITSSRRALFIAAYKIYINGVRTPCNIIHSGQCITHRDHDQNINSTQPRRARIANISQFRYKLSGGACRLILNLTYYNHFIIIIAHHHHHHHHGCMASYFDKNI
jgi:hypothetical protein